MKEVSEKITERIRKLIRLKESATQIGSEGEAHAAAAAIHRLLMEYNLSLLDLAGENPQNRLTACESDRISYKDAAGNIWKRDLMRVLCEYNYCKMLLYAGTTHMVVIGTEENAATVIALFDYLRKTFRRLSEEKYSGYAQGRRGYWRTAKGKKDYIRSYLEGCIPRFTHAAGEVRADAAGNRPHDLSPKTDRRLYGQVQACQKKACGEQA